MLPLFSVGGADIVNQLVASPQEAPGGNVYDWHQELVNSNHARSSNSTHFMTYVKLPARNTTDGEGPKLKVIPTLNKVAGSHPSVSEQVGILHVELSSISEWFSNDGSDDALLNLLPDLNKTVGNINWISPATFARSMKLHRVHAVSAATNAILTQLQLLSSARGNLMTCAKEGSIVVDHGPSSKGSLKQGTDTKRLFGLDLEAVLESILLPSFNLAAGLHYASAFLQDDKEKKQEEMRKRRKEQKQAYIKQKRLNEQMGIPPPPPPDRSGLDALSSTPAELRALEHSRDLLLGELEDSLSALWEQAHESPRSQQVAMWLDSLMHGIGSCVL